MKGGGVAVGVSLAAHFAGLLALQPQVPHLSREYQAPVQMVEFEAPSSLAPAVTPRPTAHHDPASAAQPVSSAWAASQPRSGTPVLTNHATAAGAVAVDVAEDEAAGEAAASGSGRYYDSWKVDSLPAPRTLPSLALPGFRTASRIDLDVTVAASGRVGGVVAMGSPGVELADLAVRAVGRVRFTPAKVGGSPVSTTIAVTLLLVGGDGGTPGWEAGGTGWVLRL